MEQVQENISFVTFMDNSVKLIEEANIGMDRTIFEIYREFENGKEDIVKVTNKKSITKQSVENPEKLYELNKQIYVEKEKYPDLKIHTLRIFPVIKTGDRYLEIRDIKDLNTQLEAKISHTKGKILVVEFLNNSISTLDSYLDLMTKQNDLNNLNDKIEFSAISFDSQENIRKAFETENSKNYDFIKFYYAEEKLNHSTTNIYNVESLPFSLIVDSKGLVHYLGENSNQDLNAKLLELVKVEAEACEEQPEEKAEESLEQTSEDSILIPLLDPLVEIFKRHKENHNLLDLKYLSKFTYKLTEKAKYKTNESFKAYEQTHESYVSYRTQEASIRENLEKELTNLLGENLSKLSINFKEIKTIELLPGTECSKCGNSVVEDEYHYFNTFQMVYYCINCGNENPKPEEVWEDREFREKVIKPDPPKEEVVVEGADKKEEVVAEGDGTEKKDEVAAEGADGTEKKEEPKEEWISRWEKVLVKVIHFHRIHKKVFLIPDTMIRIPKSFKGPLIVDLYKLGNNNVVNADIKDDEVVEIHQYVTCLGCPYPTVGERFICLNCKPGDCGKGGLYFDICKYCVVKSYNIETGDQFNERLNKQNNENHQKDHVYAMVRFNYNKDYYNY